MVDAADTLPGHPAAQLGTDPASVERQFAALLTELLPGQAPEPDSHFFEDLGADSMVMARFCAKLRKNPDLPSPSMKDVYRHPTPRRLAEAFGEPEPAVVSELAAEPTAAAEPAAEPEPEFPAEPPVAPARVSTAAYLGCGAAQLVAVVAYVVGVAVATETGYRWIFAGQGLLDLYLRSVAAGVAVFAGMSLLPVVAKWLLVGRWTETEFPVWGPRYVRFWIVKTLLRTNPLLLLVHGSPLYVLYLRALGARIGKGVTILTAATPVTTDLFRVGDGTVIRKDAMINGYRAHAGWIQTGPVTIGWDAFVGEQTVIDVGAEMGDDTQLGHSSSLHRGQRIPDGESWHGTPARRTGVDHRRVRAADCGTGRRFRYGALQLVYLLVLYLPLGIAGVDLVLRQFEDVSLPWLAGQSLGPGTLVVEALLFSAVLFFGVTALGMAVATTVPRLLALAIRPERVYPLYGLHFSLHRLVTRLTNVRLFMQLFGDSSLIVHWLRALGWDLHRVAQTGSNFGTAVKHETPFLSRVGSGTMVADGLSMMNAEYSSTSFRLARTSIGAHSFLGNRIAYPAGGRTGENVLLATKVLVPLDGPVRSGTGLLGSPPFEIPRTVLRDVDLEVTGPEFERRLRRKNRHNHGTLLLILLVRWLNVLGLTAIGLGTAAAHGRFGALALAAQIVLSILFTLVWTVLVERAATGFRPLQPRTVSIYDRYFWQHERFWKLVSPGLDRILAGTPFKNTLSRALGTRVGARVFDDGCAMPERTLVSVGDDACLNAGSVVQTHSQEDGAFKSDRSHVGSRVTLGVGAFVHYGVVVGDGALVGPDTFVMKGEEVPPGAYWAGNPAHEMTQNGVSVR